MAAEFLSIGEIAARTGASVSAVRFYEARGVVRSARNAGNQRRFHRAEIRRLSFALIAQKLGLTIAEIAASLSKLPDHRVPTRADWAAISAQIARALDAKIAELQRTRDVLDGCIGCGCLSLDRCALYNPEDRAHTAGPGARFTLGNRAADFGPVPDGAGTGGEET